MGTSYGQAGYPIGTGNISVSNLTNCTLSSSGSDGVYGSWTFNMQNVGCGSTGFNLIINDATVPFVWTRIAWRTRIEFGSSCWSFANSNGDYGTGNHNISAWNVSLGDSVTKPTNCWELPQYTLKMSACDNNSDNFEHATYMTGTFRQWSMVRRRNGTSSAGPAAGFACTGGGTCTISQVLVFR
jgi:hypothetical protein